MLQPKLRCSFLCLLLFAILTLTLSSSSVAQPLNGQLTGKIIDGSSFRTLYGAQITGGISGKTTTSAADGTFVLRLAEGLHTIRVQTPGFQVKIIKNIPVHFRTVTAVSVILIPLKLSPAEGKKNRGDSIAPADSVVTRTLMQESALPVYKAAVHANTVDDLITAERTPKGADLNAVQFIKSLSGPIIRNSATGPGYQSLTISGMGDQFNQFRINNIPTFSVDGLSRAFPLDMFPVQALQQASIQHISNASVPGDAAGGTVNIDFRDMPDENFVFIQAGATAVNGTTGKTFYGDKRGPFESSGFPGNERELPAGFPTTRSPASLNQKNPQEQVFLSRTLANNLGPENFGASRPGQKIIAGLGRLIRMKKDRKLGVMIFLNQRSTEQLDHPQIQVAPDVVNNPYPFSDPSKPLIRFQASDTRYQRKTGTTGILTSAFSYGRNKISFHGYISNQLLTTFTDRAMIVKPDEDSAAHTGIRYTAAQENIVSAQLSGEHALGINGRFKLNWQFQYFYDHRQSPDERNVLLRQDSANAGLYEIAHSKSIPFVQNVQNVEANDPNLINTSRKWKESADQDFTGAVSIAAPFNLFQQAQVISGGIFIQSLNRSFHSDILFVQGPGFYPLDQLFSADRYFPGGLSLTGYHVNNPGSRNVFANQLGNYTGSVNTGSAYIRSESRLTRRLSADLGIRMESSNQLVSNSQYNYIPGFRNPQLTTLDENIYTVNFDFLPSVDLKYDLGRQLLLQAAWFLSVNRPRMQQLTKYRDYDGSTSMITMGNPALRNSSISNFDAGISWHPHTHVEITASGFYKRIIEPIETILSSYTTGSVLGTASNTPTATVSGARAGVKVSNGTAGTKRKALQVTAFADANITRSEVKAGPVRSFVTPSVASHTLSGSPDYSVNAGLMLYPTRHTLLAVWYNRTGDYLTAVGSGKIYMLPGGDSYSATPDYRIKERQEADLQLTQKLFRERFTISAGINNLLNDDYIIYQDLNGNKKFDEALVLKSIGNSGGFYSGGTDNTVMRVKYGQSYYLTFSYIF